MVSIFFAAIVCCVSPVTVPASASTGSQTTTITATGETPYTIPANTAALQVTVIGAPGASFGQGLGATGTPGNGAQVQATFAPPSGVSTLYVEIGAGAGYSMYGASGGGASDIQTCSVSTAGCTDTADPATDPRLIVAGGGGGGGNGNSDSKEGTGGSGGSAGTSSAITGPGGGGDGTSSGNGAAGSGAGLGNSSATAPGGEGAATCGGSGDTGSPGEGGQGEDANNGDSANGGGGGGGWVGGSGGGSGECGIGTGGAAGGGGAGASFVESSATAVNVAEATTSPEVVITAESDQAPAFTSGDSATFMVGKSGTFTVKTTGYPIPSLSDGGAVLPSGVTFVDNGDGTATLSGTPAAGTGGSYPITITASNNIPPDATQDFTLQVLAPPGVKITGANISSAHHEATFTFKALGSATGFQCALGKQGSKPRFTSCASPKAYTKLTAGAYTFEVRALNAAGHGSPAQKNFKIA